MKKGDKFHFIAMGGVGMSALAKILVKRGYEVSGSDINNSKYINNLRDLGAKVYIGHDKNNVPENAFVVVSSAIKEDNPELMRAKELNLPILHRSDMLLEITRKFSPVIGFAGTHGKTTTSGLCSYLLSKAALSPAFAVGGIIPELNTNADAKKNSTIFVAELDESDGTIVKYTPEITVINNLEADHPDFYKNGLGDVLKTFKEFVEKLPSSSKIIVNADDNGVLELLKIIDFKNVIKFSTKDVNADYSAQNITFNDSGAEFDLFIKGKFEGRILTSLKGIHNVYNAFAVASALIEAGVKFSEFKSYFKGFTGMGRRFQTVYKSETIEIIDDYAHHPSEIKATLTAAKSYKEKSAKNRVVAIFQPHRYTRFKGLWEEFKNSFNDADVLVVTDVFTAGDKYDETFNSKNFASEMKTPSVSRGNLKGVLYIGGKADEISDEILNIIKQGDLVLTLGAGDITKLGPILKEKLKD